MLHHDGADVALDSVAENDVTMLLQLLQKQLTLARRDAVNVCMYVCMYVCIGMANQESMVLKRKAQRYMSLYLNMYACMCMFTESNMYV